MAPIRPAKRSSIRARAAKSATSDPRGRYAPPTASDVAHEPSTTTKPSQKSALKPNTQFAGFEDAEWRLNKKDKRTIKHNTLLDKVRDSGVSKAGGKKVLKRRRPAKKLVTDLDSLADALPDASDEDDEWEGLEDEDVEEMQVDGTTATKKRKRRKVPKTAEQQGKMVMKSLNLRQGAMKKKKVMEEKERERFGKNLAAMVGTSGGKENVGDGGDKAAQTQKERWAALRSFIGGTMVTDKAFAGTTG
jgi:hypothetical protein